MAVPGAAEGGDIAAVVVTYAEGDPDTYQLPLAYAKGAESPQIL